MQRHASGQLGFRLATGHMVDGRRFRVARHPPRHRTHGGRQALPGSSASASPQDSRRTAGASGQLGFRLATGLTADGRRFRAARLPPRHRTHGGRQALPGSSASASPQNSRRTAGASGQLGFRLATGLTAGGRRFRAARLPPRHRTHGGRRLLGICTASCGPPWVLC